MAQSRSQKRGSAPAFDFLIVDTFLRDITHARALKSAFDLRLIDHLLDHAPRTSDELHRALGIDRGGLEFLLQLLSGAQVVDTVGSAYRLHARFLKALEFRDLLETKLDFSGFMAPDLIELFTLAIADPTAFMRKSRVFNLFDYRKALEQSHESYERTRAWMRLTSTLTRYEARACLERHDFGAYRRMLDVGGNSGEFALQACRRHPELTATVMDLPLVCEIAQEHVLPYPERDRIAFLAADARAHAMPRGHDLITFKSMLHDWPDSQAAQFIRSATEALHPGGTILIFERGPLDMRRHPPSFGMLPVLLFFRSYRDPTFYSRELEAAGLRDIEVNEIEVDVAFLMITARKPVTA